MHVSCSLNPLPLHRVCVYNCLATKDFIRELVTGYRMTVDDHRVAWGSQASKLVVHSIHDISWDALGRASHAP